jgi:two-component system phosphate regulon sensor histidine kinase PhoR
VDAAAREVRARVTIVAPDGRVLADSAVSGAALAALESHLDRPEVQQALAMGRGVSERRSSTVGEHMLYAAVPVRSGGTVRGVSRVALSLRGVDDQAGEFQQALLLALAAAFVVTAALAAAFASSFAGPLREVMDAARRFAAGDLAARSHVRRRDELGELAQILNRSADQLQARITEIGRDRARTEAILSAMEDGVLAVDHRGMVVLANEALRHQLGLADPVGRHYMEVLRQREVAQALEEVLRAGRRVSLEMEMRRPRRDYALAAVPFPGAEATPHGAVLTFHDVTERRRVDQVRRDFVANASHELRTPLTSIKGFVEALEDGATTDPATARRFLGKIRTHADRMAMLVADLLELSRLESGERPPQWEPIVPAALVEEVVGSFAGTAARKDMALVQGGSGGPEIVSDPERLRGILDNLVENAIKYTPSGGRVEVAADAGTDGGAVFTVTDDGPGIASEHLPRIFERFYRVDKARSRDLGGTGLGLSIVRHLAEGMRASVTVESELGRGTRFTVTVPPRPHAP